MEQPDSRPVVNELYYPSPDIFSSAHISVYEKLYAFSCEQPEEFWAEKAEELEWFQN